MTIILCNATDIGVKSVQEAQLVDTGNKLVRDNLAVSIPVLPVLGRASKITSASVIPSIKALLTFRNRAQPGERER
jgi:hypothetical protein